MSNIARRSEPHFCQSYPCLASLANAPLLQTHSHPLFTTMILAWSITEVIRYAFYACALVGLQPKFLLWLR